MPDKTLCLMCGLPRSGKSTEARKISNVQGWPIVNPDSVRLAVHGQKFKKEAEDLVWAITRIMVRALFLAGHDTVILDATNITRKRRKFWESPEWNLKVRLMPTDAATCRARATAENDLEMIDVITRMELEWEPLEGDEEELWA